MKQLIAFLSLASFQALSSTPTIVETTGSENYATYNHSTFKVDYHIKVKQNNQLVYETHVNSSYKKGVAPTAIPIAEYSHHNFPSEYKVIQHGDITKVDIEYQQIQSGFMISIRPGPAVNSNHSFWVEWRQDVLDSLVPVGKTPNGLKTFAPVISQMSASKNITVANKGTYVIDPEYRGYLLEITPTLNYDITRETPKIRHKY